MTHLAQVLQPRPPPCRFPPSSHAPFSGVAAHRISELGLGSGPCGDDCLHLSEGGSETRGPRPAGDACLQGCIASPGARGAGAAQAGEEQRGSGFSGRAHGAGPRTGTNSARVLVGVGTGSGPGIPVAAAVFSGPRVLSARGGAPWLAGIAPERCVLRVGE